MRGSVRKRFFDKVYIGSATSCWVWTAGSTRAGCGGDLYGRFAFEGKCAFAHRFSYMLFKGKIPDGMFVCHKCDNSLCVNPHHLFLGTPKDNMQDMIMKGRDYHPVKGESNPNAKLKKKQVELIKEMIADGIHNKTISEIYGVASTTISDIKVKRAWSHV